MKVLHTVAGNLFGGVETLLVTLARCRGLCPAMEPHFAICYEGRLSEELTATGVPVHRLSPVRISRPWTLWRGRSQFRQLLRRDRFDRIVCHSSWPLAVFGSAGRSEGVPVVLWVHGWPSRRSWLDRWALWTAPALTICNSRFIEGEMRRHFPRVRCTSLYYPVELEAKKPDAAALAAVRSELNSPPEAVVILQASRMEAWKGHESHLQALSRLPREANWRCWMAGGAQRPAEIEYVMRLKRLSAELGVADRVLFLGERSDVPALLQAADLYCQPNTGPEPFGIAFIEALAAGLPVVTTALGGAQEIVDESCGLRVIPGDSAALANALCDLLLDRAMRRRLGEQGPARACALCEPQTQICKLFKKLTLLDHQAAGSQVLSTQ